MAGSWSYWLFVWIQLALALPMMVLADHEEACTFREYGDVRLLDGATPEEGRVELCIDGVWERIGGASWGGSQAMVVCRQLGFFKGYTIINDAFGTGETPLRYRAVSCGGNELKLINCVLMTDTKIIEYEDDAGVLCSDKRPPRNVTVHIIEISEIAVSWSSLNNNDLLIRYDISCDIGNYIQLKASVENTTTSFTFQHPLEQNNYTCCVSSVFSSLSISTACNSSNGTVTIEDSSNGTVVIEDSIQPTTPSHMKPSNNGCNADAVGGVLGFIVIVLVVLLVLCCIALAYPRWIRPKLEQSGHLSTLKNVLDRTLHNPTYGANMTLPTTINATGTIDSRGTNTLGHSYETIDHGTTIPGRYRPANHDDHTDMDSNMAYSSQYEVVRSGSAMRSQRDRLQGSTDPNERTAPGYKSTQGNVADIDPMRYEVSEAYLAAGQEVGAVQSGSRQKSKGPELDEGGYANLEQMS